MTIRIATILFLTVLLPAIVFAQDKPVVRAVLERDKVFEGDTVIYQVEVRNTDNLPDPKLEGFEELFKVEPAGKQDNSSYQSITINGRRTEVSNQSIVYQYRLIPRKAGDITIPAPVVEVDGKTYRGPELKLQVVGAELQDLVLIEMSVDKKTVFPVQPFSVTLSVFVRQLPTPYAKQNPVAVDTFPRLQIPWVDDESNEGLKPVQDSQNWLSRLHNAEGYGFAINNIRPRGIMILHRRRPPTFLPRSKQVEREAPSGKTYTYWQFDFTRQFTASRIDSFKFDASVKGDFVDAITNRRPKLMSVFASAKPVEVHVIDAPQQDRPDTFTGAFGRFTINAAISPTNAKVGDPLTLTFDVRGEGLLDIARAPNIESAPEVADNFRLYEATDEKTDKGRRYILSLRPLHANIDAFPSIAYSYFDVDKKQYETVHTKPVPLKIVEAEAMKAGQIVSAQGPRVKDSSIEARADGIFANVNDPSQLRDQSVRPAAWAGGLGALVVFYFVASVLIGRFHTTSRDEALRRRRRAAVRARDALQAAGSDPQLMQDAFLGLVADVVNEPQSGMTAADAASHLAILFDDEALQNETKTLLDRCEGARYGGGVGGDERFSANAADLLNRLIQALKAAKRLN